MKHLCPRCLVLLASLAAFTACGDDPSDEAQTEAGLYDCEGDLVGEVSASDWVRQHSDIDRYRYLIPADGSAPEFTFVAADDTSLGMLTVERVDDGERPVFVSAQVFSDEGLVLTADIEEAVSPADTYVLTAEVEQPNDGRRFGLWAEFGAGECQAEPVQDGLPACVGGLPMDNPLFVTPGCGLSREAFEHPAETLNSLTYYAPLNGAPIPLDGGVRQGRDARFATLEVMSRGRVLPVENVERWVDDIDVSDLLEAPEHRLLVLAFLDRPWLDRPREHANYCQAPDLFPAAGSFLCENSRRSVASQALFGSNGCLANIGDLTALPSDNPTPFDFECQGVGCMGWVWGDPHFTTHDGTFFNFQGAGEYVLAQALEGPEWEIQARFEPLDGARDLPICRNVTVTTSVATMLDGRRVEISSHAADELLVDGVAFDLRKEQVPLSDGYLLEPSDVGYRLAWPSGEWIEVGTGNSMNIDFSLPAERAGKIAGIMGYFDGDQTREFVTRDGRILAGGLDYDPLYLDFGESWRITDAQDSFFDYADGDGPETFFIDGFPDPSLDEFELPPDEATEAEEICAGEGITNPALFEACVLDFVCSLDRNMAAQSAVVSEPMAVAEAGILVSGDIRLVDSFADAPKVATGPYCEPPKDALLVPERAEHTLVIPEPIERPSGTLAAGTSVTTYILYRSAAQAGPMHGNIYFDRPILGVQHSRRALALGALVRASELDYPHTVFDGIELDAGDALSLSPDLHSISVSFEGEGDIDYMRIFVEGGAP